MTNCLGASSVSSVISMSDNGGFERSGSGTGVSATNVTPKIEVGGNEFSVRYSGEALESGSMQVSDLAPALLALGKAFTSAHELLYPDEPRVALQIRATEAGSFIVHLQLTQKLLKQVVNLFSGQEATAAANLTALVATAWGSIKWLQNKPTRQEELPNGSVRFTQENGDVLEMDGRTFLLVRDQEFREASQRAFRPVSTPGITSVEIKSQGTVLLEVGASDLASFDIPEKQLAVPLVESTTEMAVAVASVSFVDGNKWRFSDGESTFFASIGDEAFLARVERNELRFGKGDVLNVRMRVRQWTTNDGLKVDREIVEVLKHTAGPRQITLPFFD